MMATRCHPWVVSKFSLFLIPRGSSALQYQGSPGHNAPPPEQVSASRRPQGGPKAARSLHLGPQPQRYGPAIGPTPPPHFGVHQPPELPQPPPQPWPSRPPVSPHPDLEQHQLSTSPYSNSARVPLRSHLYFGPRRQQRHSPLSHSAGRAPGPAPAT